MKPILRYNKVTKELHSCSVAYRNSGHWNVPGSNKPGLLKLLVANRKLVPEPSQVGRETAICKSLDLLRS